MFCFWMVVEYQFIFNYLKLSGIIVFVEFLFRHIDHTNKNLFSTNFILMNIICFWIISISHELFEWMEFWFNLLLYKLLLQIKSLLNHNSYILIQLLIYCTFSGYVNSNRFLSQNKFIIEDKISQGYQPIQVSEKNIEFGIM